MITLLKTNKKIIVVTAIISTFIIYAACTSNNSDSKKEGVSLRSEETFTTSITIGPNVPLDVSDPSNLAEAANFAWNEFIALTWPADSSSRGKPLVKGNYGDRGPDGSVVWETYRAKVEVYTGSGPGVSGDPNGYDPSKPDFGFSSKPDYVYDPNSPGIDATGHVKPFPGTKPGKFPPPYHNLDEVTQITLNTMYGGVSGTDKAGPASQKSSTAQKILFEAKVNETYYKYVAANKYYQSDSPRVAAIKTNSIMFAETGDGTKYPPPYMNLPASNPTANELGTIEIKASFRKLNPKTEDITKFYTARVRYYSKGTGRGLQGYLDSDTQNEVWGLTSLHIIHKTPNAPAFVYATFSQYNNILDADGNSVEDVDGNTLDKYKNIEPFTPALSITNSSVSSPTNPQKVFIKTGSAMPNTNSPELYFRNALGLEAIYTDSTLTKLYSGPVNVNRRIYPIPATIVNANKMAHAAIKKVNPNAVWLNYKLVNVQAEPLDYVRDSARIFRTDDQSLSPTFFLANEVVETNPSLQNFSGGLNTNGANGNISNRVYTDATNTTTEYDFNVYVRPVGKPGTGYNMGGCMGCHGSQGQKSGGDFSVLLARGRTSTGTPEPIELDEQNTAQMQAIRKKYLKQSPH